MNLKRVLNADNRGGLVLPVSFIGYDAFDNGFGACVLIAAALGTAAFVGIAEVGAFYEDGWAVGKS